MDVDTAQILLNKLFDGDIANAVQAWNTALDLFSGGLFWDFWALMLPVVTYLYTESERSTLAVMMIVLTVGYQLGILGLSLPVLVVGSVLLTAKLLWSVVAQVRL